MSNSTTADIIPFRTRLAPDDGPDISDGDAATPAAFRADALHEPPLHLAGAMSRLNAALAEQRMAVAAWRHAVTDLNTTMRGLTISVQRYRGTLAALDSKVSNLCGEAVRMEHWAEHALNKPEPPEPGAANPTVGG
jgi:hypothetical protein